ncbi:MAG: DedA family protein [Solirubrobacteraceae bacterium]|nr:DedA family protein [Solirubrobacteraceae bacterium]
MKPVWLICAAALTVFLAVRRRRLEPLLLIGGALAVAWMAVYSTGVIELPDLGSLLEDIGRALGPWTYLLVAVVSFMEAAAFLGLFVPGETGILVGGVVAGQGEIDIVILIAVAWSAAFAGDLTGYALGRRFGRPFLVAHGRRFGLTEERIEAVDGFFQRHGGKTIFVGRFVGLVRSLSPFLAGASRMPLRRFVPYDILGSGVQTTLLCLAGFLLWRSLDTVLTLAKQGAVAFSVTIVAVTALIVAIRFLRDPAKRARAAAWLADRDDRLTVRLLLVVGRRGRRPAWFVADRLTPGNLGLELTSLLAAASVAGYVFFGYLVLLSAGAPTSGDRRALSLAGDLRTTTLDDVAETFLRLGDPAVVGVALCVVAAWLIVRRECLEGIVLLAGLGLIVGGVELTQLSTQRTGLPGDADGDAYPSPQAAYATAWIAIAIALRRGSPRLTYQAAVLVAAVTVVAAVAGSIVYAGSGWFSDAAGGVALGTLVFCVAGITGLVLAAAGEQRRRSR